MNMEEQKGETTDGASQENTGQQNGRTVEPKTAMSRSISVGGDTQMKSSALSERPRGSPVR